MKRLAAILCLALALLPGSAESGDGDDFGKGNTAYDVGDCAAALREWRSLARQEDAEAQFDLALMYEDGKSVPQSHETAAERYERVAKQRHSGTLIFATSVVDLT